jgi:hypothetical protein
MELMWDIYKSADIRRSFSAVVTSQALHAAAHFPLGLSLLLSSAGGLKHRPAEVELLDSRGVDTARPWRRGGVATLASKKEGRLRPYKIDCHNR